MLRQNLDYDYSKLPKSTIFEVDYIEDGFASCMDTSQKHSEKYCIPSKLLDESAKKYDTLIWMVIIFIISRRYNCISWFYYIYMRSY